MPKVKATVQVDGADREVEIDPGALGLLTSEEVTEKYLPRESFQTELDRRVRSLTKGKHTPEEIAGNEEMLRAFATTNADALRGILAIKPGATPAEEIELIREQVREQELKPLQEKVTTLTKSVEEGRLQKLRADATAACAELGVRKGLIPFVLAQYERDAVWSEEHGDFLIPDGKGGFALAPANPDGVVYMTPALDLAAKRRSGQHGDLFDAAARDGLGYGGARNASGAVSLEQFRKMDSNERVGMAQERPEDYRRLMGEIQAEGEAKLFGE